MRTGNHQPAGEQAAPAPRALLALGLAIFVIHLAALIFALIHFFGA